MQKNIKLGILFNYVKEARIRFQAAERNTREPEGGDTGFTNRLSEEWAGTTSVMPLDFVVS